MGYTFGHINELAEECHAIAIKKGFWTQVDRGVPWEYVIGQKLLLMHSEITEAMEVIREHPPGSDTDKLLAEELADIIIRIFDLAGWLGLDIERAIEDKIEKNRDRPMMHGKAF